MVAPTSCRFSASACSRTIASRRWRRLVTLSTAVITGTLLDVATVLQVGDYCRTPARWVVSPAFRFICDSYNGCHAVPYDEGLLVPSSLEANMTKPAASLYQRMGGYDVIAAVIDDL